MNPRNEPLGQERRKYIRLDSVFPVQARLLSLDAKHFLSGWLQTFTNNISKGGICLEANNLELDLVKLIQGKQIKVSLDIEVPLGKSVKAIAKIAWFKEVFAGPPNKYLIGLSYEEIDQRQNIGIMRYANARRLFAPALLTIIGILTLGLLVNGYINVKLIRGNKALIGQLVKILQESSIAKQKVKEINKEREDLQLRIQALELRIQGVEEERAKLGEKVKTEEATATQKIQELSGLIEKLAQEKSSLQGKLINVQQKESNITEDLLRLDKKKAILEKDNFDRVYQWLKVHQNPRTGLIISFEGDGDIADWSFIYDQSLAAQAYTFFGDFERAKKIFNFFAKKAEKKDGLFCNAYYANDGKPAEYILHSGPNIWLGIAILQYTKKSQDNSYLVLAEDIARRIIQLQKQDKDGGLRGGPNVEWYATEHNLDAYAFLNMLYKITNKQAYLEAKNNTLNWLMMHTYDKLDIPIIRGKGDSTIATDTYAWSIAAIGPEKLEELGLNPDKIVEFAQDNCAVEVSYCRLEGNNVKIKGFDFAPQRHVARGGVVSSEWTAQMVLAFKIMGDFYRKKGVIAKARSYELKADEYLVGLYNMITSSPSPTGQGEGCLPYATQDFIDTGHGWMTPKGKATGSVAGTAYTLFAYYKYNPLELKE